MKNRATFSTISRILIGLMVTMFGYHAFLNPYGISVGGITGACVLLNEYFGLPYTATLLVLNIVLFIWGIRVKGLPYVLRSLGAMIALGLLLDLQLPVLPNLTPSSDVMAMVLGSLLTGVGYGLIVSADTSTGGSDLLAMIVVKRIPNLTVGLVMNGVDLIVVLASGIFKGMQSFLFSIVAMLLCNGLIDITAYCFGSVELPKWLLRLKPKGQALRKHILEARIVVNPYAACLITCILLLVLRNFIVIDAVASHLVV